MILLDTSILIDNLRNRDDAAEALDAAADAGQEFAASTLTMVEVLAGMRSHERRATRVLLDALTWIDADEDICEQAGVFARQYRGTYQGVDVVDYVIAATAQHLDAELWTRNIKHFPMFPELTAPY